MIVFKATNNDMTCNQGREYSISLEYRRRQNGHNAHQQDCMPASMYWTAHGITDWAPVTGILKPKQKETLQKTDTTPASHAQN